MYRFEYTVGASAANPVSQEAGAFDQFEIRKNESNTVNIIFSTVDDGNLGLHVGDDSKHVRDCRLRINDRIVGHSPTHYMNQTHSTMTKNIYSDLRDDPLYLNADDEHRADALVSAGEYPLAVMTADCVPLIMIASSDDVIAAYGVVHAGRKGVLDDIIKSSIEALVELLALEDKTLTALDVVIGPHICAECYEVSQEMYDASVQVLPALGSSLTTNGSPRLDLLSGVIDRLKAQEKRYDLKTRIVLFTSDYSLRELHCSSEPSLEKNKTCRCVCTYEDSHFYSYRRFIHTQEGQFQMSLENINGRFSSIVFQSRAQP